MAYTPEAKKPGKARRVTRLLNWVVPLRETAAFGREVGKTTTAIGSLGKQLKDQLRKATSPEAEAGAVVAVPSGEEGRSLALRGRMTWACGLLLFCAAAWVAGVWLATSAPALLHTLQALMGVLLLIVAGLHLGVQGSALWHSVKRGRWVPPREVLGSPSLWLPF